MHDRRSIESIEFPFLALIAPSSVCSDGGVFLALGLNCVLGFAPTLFGGPKRHRSFTGNVVENSAWWRTSPPGKKFQGFGNGLVYHLLKTVFNYQEDSSEREHLPRKDQNPYYENDTYRQSVRIHAVHRSRRLGLGRTRKQTHGTGFFRRKSHIQFASRAQGHEAGWPSGQRLCLQPLKKAVFETKSPGGICARAIFYAMTSTHRRRAIEEANRLRAAWSDSSTGWQPGSAEHLR
jgi:hypothetical protein